MTLTEMSSPLPNSRLEETKSILVSLSSPKLSFLPDNKPPKLPFLVSPVVTQRPSQLVGSAGSQEKCTTFIALLLMCISEPVPRVVSDNSPRKPSRTPHPSPSFVRSPVVVFLA